MEQRVARPEPSARQPRLAMEADGSANTKTCERTEGAATAVQAMHVDSCSATRVDPGPKTDSTSFGIMVEPPDLPCREDVLVEDGAAAPKSCLPSLKMRITTAAGGLLPTGKISTATKTTFNKPPLRLYSTEKTNSKETNLWTSVLSAWYDSSKGSSRLQELKGRTEVMPSMAARGYWKLGANGCRGASWSEELTATQRSGVRSGAVRIPVFLGTVFTLLQLLHCGMVVLKCTLVLL